VAFILDPETLNASAREWTVQGQQEGAEALYIVHVNVEDLRVAHPDLPHDQPDEALRVRRSAWERACEKAIAGSRPMPIYHDETPAKDTGLSHMRIVLQPDEM